ncbi:MAG: hypothetical protein B7Y99_04970 [Caulobacterales bacterium 32-69-10]|nr:MAG: hypothetical protein B7Y99_04970 [Caulobacterales bacterium 32-69-10]
MARRIALLGLGVAACAASVGLVLAQDLSPPPPPGYVPGQGYAPAPSPPAQVQPGPFQPGPFQPGPAPTQPPSGPPPVVTLQQAPPPEEATPPPEIAEEVNEPPIPDTPPPVKKGEVQKRPRFASAILQAVDKITAQTLRFEAKVGEPVRYKGLVLTVHACEGAAGDEGFTDSIAHVDVQAQPEALSRQAARIVFRGWMFASSPGLHPVEHPLYDVWLIACKTPAPGAPGVKL